MVKLGDYITKNYDVVDKLLKSGKVPVSLKTEYEIYQYFNTTGHLKSTMQRYTNTAEAMRVSERTVMRAVKEMRKIV